MTAAWRRSWVPLLAAAGLGLGALAANAALFEDDEARKAILELRTRVKHNDDAVKARLAELAAANQQLGETVQQLRRSLLDLNNQLEAMRLELARLRGSDEQLARDLADVQKRQKDIAQGLDDRLRRLEPQKVAPDRGDRFPRALSARPRLAFCGDREGGPNSALRCSIWSWVRPSTRRAALRTGR